MLTPVQLTLTSPNEMMHWQGEKLSLHGTCPKTGQNIPILTAILAA